MKSFDSYLRTLILPQEFSICLLDVGARWGLNPPWNQLPTEFVSYYGFEPDGLEYEKLTKNLPVGVSYLNTALLDKEKSVELFITREPGCSSTLLPNKTLLDNYFLSDRWDVVSEQSVVVEPLDLVMRVNNITPDAIKIDVQGAAFEVLEGGTKALEHILLVDVETEFQEMYKGQKLFDSVFMKMIQSDFMLLDINKHWARRKVLGSQFSSRGQVVFGDCLFMKNPERIFDHLDIGDIVSRRILTYKYIVLASMYGHFDLALEVVEQSESPLNFEEKRDIRRTIEEFTKFGPIIRFTSRFHFAGKLGWLGSHLFARFQGADRFFGWGSDFNTVEKRYRYLSNGLLANFFRK